MNCCSPIRVLVVDDHYAIRRTVGLALLVYGDIQQVGEAAGGAEAVQLCPELRPDVIIMDLQMPDMDGVAATAAIRKRCPTIKIIALSSFKDQSRVKAALEAGADNYLLKDISIDELAVAIRQVTADSKPEDRASF